MKQEGITQHTPGPWHIQAVEYFTDRAFISADSDDLNDGSQIAELFGSDRHANSRLIAAAPELLEALKAMVQESGRSGGYAVNLSRAAIAKAEGRA